MTFEKEVLANQVLGLAITAGLFVAIKMIFQGKDGKFIDFFKTMEEGYSLSRLQAVAWASVIIAFQISVIICILSNTRKTVDFSQYKIVFSENILILLGLSLGSYVAVKGITTRQITQGTARTQFKGDLSDIITDSNGLDFSKFQMLVWTLLAILDFFTVSHYYLYNISHAHTLAGFLDPDSKVVETTLPTVQSTFLILMGISQGAYIGKKLIPVDQANAFKSDQNIDLQKQVDILNLKIVEETDKAKVLEGNANRSIEQQASLVVIKTNLIELKAQLARVNYQISDLKSIT